MSIKINKSSQDAVFKRLNEHILKINQLTAANIMKTLFYIEREAVPRTPLDTGKLRNSFYRKLLVYNKKRIAGEIGNSAEYALPVHENMNSKHPVGQAQFLGATILENENKVLNMLKTGLAV